MGMSEDMLSCIRALAENRIQDAKNKAIICCINDNTKKNDSRTSYYKKLLENGSTNLFELPTNLNGLINIQDVSGFNEGRYYLGKQQKKLFTYGIPYSSILIVTSTPFSIFLNSFFCCFPRCEK